MPTLYFKEYCLDIPARVYLPSDDTYLMLDALEQEIIKQNKTYNRAIELGSGNAFLSLAIYNNITEISATDINPIAIDYLLNVKEKYNLEKMKILYSNLFESIDPKDKYDLIVFNPPYVPTEELTEDNDLDEINGYNLAVNGGENGRKIIDKFIEQLPKHLNEKGDCFLLVSSLNNPLEVIENLKQKNLNAKIIDSKKLFFEELFVLKINWN